MILTDPRRARLRAAIALGLALACAAAFWVPAWRRSRGHFPAPLDDVYIHFDFARAWASGYPLSWIAGQGPSSGETAPLYAVLLGAGHAMGFGGRWLGAWAAVLAVGSAAWMARGVGTLVGGGLWLRAGAGALVLSVGLVDWSLFSGMEIAPFCAALTGALIALSRVHNPMLRRNMTLERAAWRLGAWGPVLVWLRPEAAVIVCVLAIAAVRAVGRRAALPALARVALPGALATLAVLAANRWTTGETASAGAQLKLVTFHPFLDDAARARIVLANLGHLFVRGLGAELNAFSFARPVLLVAVLAAFTRRTRAVAAAALASAGAFALLVSLNSAAPYQNLRYYVPPIFLVLVTAALGVGAIARMRRGAPVAIALTTALLATGAPTIARQARHFARAAGNIREQQVEAGLRLARIMPAGATVLVGDAGAIPYVSRRGAVDALGLGGYRGLPFARASVHGEGATLELLERLDPGDRPTHMALHPNWFSETTRFGREIDRLILEDNVICAGRTLSLYEADWGALGGGPSTEGPGDELDVGDVISEREHDYEAPFPRGGHTLVSVRRASDERARFDAGRVVPAGAVERFSVRRAPPGPVRVRVRTDGATGGASLRRVPPAGASPRPGESELATPTRTGAAPPGDRWRDITFTFTSLRAGERLELRAETGELHDFHVWIEPAQGAAGHAVRVAR